MVRAGRLRLEQAPDRLAVVRLTQIRRVPAGARAEEEQSESEDDGAGEEEEQDDDSEEESDSEEDEGQSTEPNCGCCRRGRGLCTQRGVPGHLPLQQICVRR